MKSIRLYLLLALIATITLVNFVSLLHGYRSSMAQAQQLFDSRLESVAKLIATANNEQSENNRISDQHTPYVFFQIFDDQGTLITRSSNAPEIALAELSAGFHDVNFSSYRWRYCVYKDQALRRWIVTSERSDIRYTLAEQVVLESILPIVLGIPVAALIIWWAVGVGLRPLRELTGQLNKKQADDLSPVVLEQAPKELAQLVRTTNDLFKRLDSAFEREQRFSADAAHELRTPISVLKVHLHNLQTTLGDNNQDLNLLRQGVERMGHLVEQILALYRTSPDQLSVKFIDIDIYSIAQNIIARDYNQFEQKDQTIELVGEHANLIANQFALETLIQNLLTNASKYTPDKGTIIVTTRKISAGVRLSVEDSGPGIPSEHYQRVFDRFYRLNGDQHDSGSIGCGLGLAIIKHIVDLHHASVVLGRSQFKSGLKVTIDFPIENTR